MTLVNKGKMKIFNLIIYDSNAGEIDCGHYRTRQLAMEQKREIEKGYGIKLGKEEYEIKVIKIHG